MSILYEYDLIYVENSSYILIYRDTIQNVKNRLV